jgi:hypothetical protein
MGMYLGKKRVDFITQTKEKPAQEKVVEISDKQQIIIPDLGYELTRVIVEPFSSNYLTMVKQKLKEEENQLANTLDTNTIIEDLETELTTQTEGLNNLDNLLKTYLVEDEEVEDE